FPARLLSHLAQRRVGGRLTRIQRALRQRPHGLVAKVTRADQQHVAVLVDDEAAGGKLQHGTRARRRAHDLMIRWPAVCSMPRSVVGGLAVVIVGFAAAGAAAQPFTEPSSGTKSESAADAYGEMLRRSDADAHARYVRLREARDSSRTELMRAQERYRAGG